MNEPPPLPPILPQSPGVANWNGRAISVRGRVVPRYLWTTTSIDVYLGDQCILQTGGKLNPVGSFSATFNHGGIEHTAELSWGVSVFYSFPYKLKIDGAPVMNSQVRADNWYIALIVGMVFGIILGVIVFLLGLPFLHRTLP